MAKLGSLQPWHWIIVIAVFVLLFGAKKLPDAARSLGKSMRIFKSEIKEMQSESQSTPRPVTAERVDPVDQTPAPSDNPDKHPA
ncbi:sec-independent protein translocase protein TatA [Mycobacterium sp. MAA66]